MVDWVKIDVPNLHGKEWLNNPLLNWRTIINPQTGEVLEHKQTAIYWGLVFTLTESNNPQNGLNCSVRGSLHRYHTKGKDNANDFNFEQLQAVILDLKNKFGIQPHAAILRNIEFGLNITPPTTAAHLLKNLVASGKNTFAALKVAGKYVGKSVPLTQTKLKIYDKAKAAKRKGLNLVRIEMHVQKMQYLKKYHVSNLADLQQPEKVFALGGVIVEQWQNIIYYDKKIQFKNMTPYQQKKILYYAAARNWADFNRVQRMRAKKQFKKLMDLHGNGNPDHTKIAAKIAQKWQRLGGKKCIRFYRLVNDMSSKKVYTFLPLKYTGKTYTPHPPNNNPKNNPKNPKIPPRIFKQKPKPKKTCLVCKKDITPKPKKTKYCTKTCNNKINGKKRRTREKLQRQKEHNQLAKMQAQKIQWLQITTTEETVTLAPAEIMPPPQTVKSILRLTVIFKDKRKKPQTITAARARLLIKRITENNIKTPKK